MRIPTKKTKILETMMKMKTKTKRIPEMTRKKMKMTKSLSTSWKSIP